MARTNGASELRLSAISSIHLPGGTVFRPYQFCTQSAPRPPGCTYRTIFLYIPTIPSSMWDSLLKCRDRHMLWGRPDEKPVFETGLWQWCPSPTIPPYSASSHKKTGAARAAVCLPPSPDHLQDETYGRCVTRKTCVRVISQHGLTPVCLQFKIPLLCFLLKFICFSGFGGTSVSESPNAESLVPIRALQATKDVHKRLRLPCYPA